MLMVWPVIQLALAIVVLTWSADKFVDYSTQLARALGVSRLVIGLLLIGFGTSFPELVVSLLAALQGAPDLALGNVIGSNIANKALVGGFAALICPIMIQSRVLRREFPLLLIATVVVWLLMCNGHLSLVDGVIMWLLFVMYCVVICRWGKQESGNDALLTACVHEAPVQGQYSIALLGGWLMSLVLLLGSSHVIVTAAVSIATQLGISHIVIGLTVVAIGTSLPEMAATVACARRGEHDMAIGNVVGSSVFNLLPVLAMPAMVSPFSVGPVVLYRDYVIMLLFMLLFWLLAWLPPRRYTLGRSAGVLLLLAYFSYITVVALTA